jgi:cystathionine beta-lyase
VSRLAEVVFEHRQGARDHHASNPASVYGNAYMPAKGFHRNSLLWIVVQEKCQMAGRVEYCGRVTGPTSLKWDCDEIEMLVQKSMGIMPSMQYDFDHPPDRQSSECFKWQTYQEDVLPMWVADMDFISPVPVIQALVERVSHGVFGYPRGLENRPGDLPELRQAVMSWLARRYGWQIQPEWIVFVPGVVTGFNLACHAFAGTQGGVLVQTPVYPPIVKAARETGCIHQQAELCYGVDGVYEVDWDRFEAAFTPATRLFILCNPHNPTGRVYRQDELERMADICLRRGVIICSDEIHADLVFRGRRHLPVANLAPEFGQNSLTLLAPSKTFNLAGLQCSLAIIPNPELRKQYLASRKGLVPWVNLMGLVAAQAAYQAGEEWLGQLLIYLEANRNCLVEYVNSQLPGVKMAAPEGTYLGWLDCREAAVKDNPYEFFLQRARVATNDGRTFGCGGEGFVRLNFGCSRSMLMESLERMRQALQAA